MDYIFSIFKSIYLPLTQQIVRKKDDNNFYYLSLLKQQNIKENKLKYSIHGLWPQYDKINYPTYCKDVNFSIQNITPILDDLDVCWYSNVEKNADFWKHEYEKHGSCMFKDMCEYEYFNTTLKLYHTAMMNNIPDKFYNETTKKCLIPVSLDFKIIQSPQQKETL